MNTLEQLSSETNHSEYLSRMEKSSHFSTKQNIPSIIAAHGCKTVLDVGCADGSFTKRIADESGAETTGLDINEKSIRLARKKFPGIDFVCAELSHLGSDKKFDCIVFCSVMHEISSYFPITWFRYTKKPIERAIMFATAHLNPGGIIIVRDGLSHMQQYAQKFVRTKFTSTKYSKLFKKFTEEFAAKDIFNTPQKIWIEEGKTEFLIAEDYLMEFLLIATWGTRSWKREVRERKLICTKSEWIEILKSNGLKICSWLQTNEEYPEYFEKICEGTRWDGWEIPDTTCVVVAKKE